MDDAGSIGYNNLSPFDQGWVVDLLDGEGYMRRQSRGGSHVRLKMCDRDTVERYSRLIGATTSVKSYSDPRKSVKGIPYATMYICNLYGAPAKELMNAIYPHMCERRQVQIQGALI